MSVIALPAFLISCTGEMPEGHGPLLPDLPGNASIALKLDGTAGMPGARYDSIDIIVFNDDRLQRLDSYQRIAVHDGETVFAASRSGKKIIAVIANPHAGRYGWQDISSFHALRSKKSDLRKEDPGALMMSGYATAAGGGKCRVALEPMVSEIRLESIRCDFSSRPYAGARLEEVKVYLTNVNYEARFFQTEGFLPESICNSGHLDSDCLSTFEHPDILMQEVDGPVGTSEVKPGISLMCYPNECAEESAGSPFTRLVIEGKINGRTCFYPININRGATGKEAAPGVGRNCRYIYDVVIKSTGSSDPEMVVTPADIDIRCDIVPWEEDTGNEIEF